MVYLILGVLLALAAPANLDDAEAKQIEGANALMKAGKAADAAMIAQAVADRYETRYRAEKRVIFCSPTPIEMIHYLGKSAGTKTAAIAVSGTWCEALFLVAYALIEQKRYAEATPLLQRAIAMAPLHAHYLNELGYIYQAQRDFIASLATYDLALAATVELEMPTDIEVARAQRGRGYALIELSRWDEAEAAHRAALKIEPDNPISLGELKFIAEQRGKPLL